MKNGCWLFLFIFWATPSFALRLPAVIGNNMVLQQQSTPKLWGWADPGEKIYVTTSWDNKTDSVKGTRDGNWQIHVVTPAAGGPYTIRLRGDNTILLENVMIGEVWVCSGQSNMEMSETWGLPDVKSELSSCTTNNIHFFHISRATSPYPQDDCNGQWTACDSNTLKTFSAAAYFFSKKLNQDLNVPIGLIEAAWGGTPAEVWTPKELVEGDSLLKSTAARQAPYDGWPDTAGYCYNAMIAPVTSFTIAGAIWYQGEANVAVPWVYSHQFTTMIGAWRKAWNKELPFYFVQIAPFTYGRKTAAYLREQQSNSQQLSHTGMVVISDLADDTTNIHPKNKHDVGLRLANLALAETYGKSGLLYKSPAYEEMEIKGNKIIVQVAGAPNGLVVKGGKTREVSVAGPDQVFYPAEARVEGSRIILSAAVVPHPVAVRYQFSDAGIGNIFSKEGLPLAPFRTDSWMPKEQ